MLTDYIVAFVMTLIFGACGAAYTQEREDFSSVHYAELVDRIKYLEDQHYRSILGPMAEKRLYDPNSGPGIYAYQDDKLMKLDLSEDPNVIIAIVGYPAYNSMYCIYISYYWQKTSDRGISFVYREIIEEGRRGASVCDPADRYARRRPKIRMLD